MARIAPARVSRGEFFAVGALLICYVAALAYQCYSVGVTIDEPSHLVSSYLYWRGDDRLAPRDLAPLIKIAGGWVSLFFSLPLPPDLGHPGDGRHEWHVAASLMEKMPHSEIQRVYFVTRLPMLIFPVLTALLLWHWARLLFGAQPAALVFLMFLLSPTPLAHGALFKNDLAATFAYLLFWFCAWRFWLTPSLMRACLLGAAGLLAVLSKLSMLVLLLAAPAVIVARALARRDMPLREAALSTVVALAIPYLGMLAASQFEFRWMDVQLLRALSATASFPKVLLPVMHVFQWLPLPAPIWDGTLSLLKNNAGFVPVYWMGYIYPAGTPWYFVGALAVKLASASLVLTLAGGVAAVVGAVRKKLIWSDLFWLLPGILYVILASFSSIQLGVRLVLPAWPFFLLMAGLAIVPLLRRKKRFILAGLVGWLAIESVSIYPRGLSFVNTLAGGPANGLRYLADSNLDWGQSLGDLSCWIRERNVKWFRLSYFGNDNVSRYFRPDQVERIPPPWIPHPGRAKRLQPEPGIWAISLSLLPGQYFAPRDRDYYRAFRARQPVAKVGHSIYVYEIPQKSW